MQYREFAPSPPLADCVKCFSVLEAESGLPIQTIYPDGCAEVVLQYGDRILRQSRSVFGGKITAFKLISFTNQEATFSNPEHDFPQRIIYRREPNGSLFARMEGNRNAKPAHEDYPMKRARYD